MEFENSFYFCKSIGWDVGSVYAEWEMGYCDNADMLLLLLL